MNRNTVISISKGIAIILMVIAHAEAPAWLCKFIFEFHMPLFFITAGYFFSLKYLNDEATFVKKRIKGLYVPFVKWSVVFLALHSERDVWQRDGRSYPPLQLAQHTAEPMEHFYCNGGLRPVPLWCILVLQRVVCGQHPIPYYI